MRLQTFLGACVAGPWGLFGTSSSSQEKRARGQGGRRSAGNEPTTAQSSSGRGESPRVAGPEVTLCKPVFFADNGEESPPQLRPEVRLLRSSSGNMDWSTISSSQFEATLLELARASKDFNKGGFTFVKTLQGAVRNHGRVDLMRTASGTEVACKRMPTRWVKTGPNEFKEQYPTASERPWDDMGFVHLLKSKGFPYACDFMGIYRDEVNTYVMTSLASEGDLFGWCDCEPMPGKCREAVMLPLVAQIFDAVRGIHVVGIAHRDLSLENILLSRTNEGLQVKLIDFGMGTLKRMCCKEVRGKQSYQAPEMHRDAEYDAFAADAFALGVVVFAMAVQDYPWISTKKNTCQLFEYVSTFGFVKLLERRKLRKGNGERLVEVLSREIVEVLDGLLKVKSQERATLGEPCFSTEDPKNPRRSVWDSAWLSGAS